MKNTVVSYLLWLLGGFGVLGLHRFYLGRWVTGLIWLLTGGLMGIGAIIDLLLIPPMVRIENLSRHLLSQARGKQPQIPMESGQMDTDRERWEARPDEPDPIGTDLCALWTLDTTE